MTYCKMMDDHIVTTEVDSREGMILNKHYRVIERVNKMTNNKLMRRLVEDNQVKTTAEDSREGMTHNS